MLSVQQSPNDKSGLGFKSNNKNKSKNNKNKKGQVQVKDPAKIVCFKCKIEGHHVRSCPLKKKQKGKRPQAQTHIQPQVEEIPLPKKNQANAPIVEKSSEKKEKKRTCYICREKGHISSFCTIGTSSNSISIDDVYSLRKDEGGNVFAKYVAHEIIVLKYIGEMNHIATGTAPSLDGELLPPHGSSGDEDGGGDGSGVDGEAFRALPRSGVPEQRLSPDLGFAMAAAGRFRGFLPPCRGFATEALNSEEGGGRLKAMTL
ncbi:hypothetical protein QYE76_010116 [Lolium multiflorum]|uniref:CCHC-type domain-containing protein n=1 Tax=Lolium multiflorum TaxID=4521 RepID=A0AAD8TWB0_LOLMU|nr:hypothetical protein QYE76_010116 [Lolium multiflorum]